MSKALVTGATGFIGKNLVKHLLSQQIGVRILTRNSYNKSTLSSTVEVVTGDLTNPLSLVDICNNVDIIFHLGGYAHAWGENNPSFADQHHAINFQGTKNILNEAIRANVKKFVFFSSVKAVADSDASIDECWEKLPDTPYGKAKRESEKLVLAAKNQGMHVCILRPALVYGPEWKGNLASMLRAIDRGFFLPLPETKNFRSMISTEDICQAAILAAQNPNANGQIYFVTDGMSYSTRELYVLMCTALNKPIPKWHIPLWFFKLLGHIGDVGSKLTKQRMPFNSEAIMKLFGSAHYKSERIQRELGFKPAYDFGKMLPTIISAYKNQK